MHKVSLTPLKGQRHECQLHNYPKVGTEDGRCLGAYALYYYEYSICIRPTLLAGIYSMPSAAPGSRKYHAVNMRAYVPSLRCVPHQMNSLGAWSILCTLFLLAQKMPLPMPGPLHQGHDNTGALCEACPFVEVALILRKHTACSGLMSGLTL